MLSPTNALLSLTTGSAALDQPGLPIVLGALGVLIAIVVFCVWMAVLIVIGIVAAVRRHRLKKQAQQGTPPAGPPIS